MADTTSNQRSIKLPEIVKLPNIDKDLDVKSFKPSELKKLPTLKLKSEWDIAMDFSAKVFQKFDRLVKATVLFGSVARHNDIAGSDIDIIIILDDATVKFDEELIVWYREELGKIIQENPYKKDLHINTIKLTTWWHDLLRGDPVVINILRYGEALIDTGGFFNPLKILLQDGKINITPEAIYTILNRVPSHIIRSKISEMSSIEGTYWAMIESSQALLMAIKVMPPSPEHIPLLMKEHFVDKGLIKIKLVTDLRDIYDLHRRITHGEMRDIDGKLVDEWQNKAEDYFKVVLKLIDEII
jgi:predicted nucleotidyltransferase